MRNRILYWTAIFAIMLGLSFWTCQYVEGSLSDCHDATCRISTPNDYRGTGCAFERAGGLIYVLTNAHVVKQHKTVNCVFWKAGHRSTPFQALVVARVLNDQCDAAVLQIPEALFMGNLPKVIPLARPTRKIAVGETILTVGCPEAKWASGLKGHALGYEGWKLAFTPTPADGRSGSAIFDATGEQIIGLLFAREVNDRYGYAVSIQALHRNLAASIKHTVHTGREDCPDCNESVGLGDGLPLPYGGRLMPWRNKEPEIAPPVAPTPYPTLPQPTPAPQPPVDLTPLGEKLDKIAELLEVVQQNTTPALVPVPEPEVRPPGVPSDPTEHDSITQALEMATENEEKIAELDEQVLDLGQGHLETKAVTASLATALDNAKKENGSVVERLQARIAEAKEEGAEGAKAVATKVVWDIVKSYGFGPVGVVGLLVFLVWRRIKTGESVVRRLRSHAKRGRLRISKLRRKLGEGTDEDDEIDEEDEAEEAEEVAEA